VIAAAATTGAIAGFGLGRDGPMAPFRTLGRLALGVTQNAGESAQSAAVVAGIVLHAAVAVAWGVTFVLIAGGLRGLRLVGAAVLFALFVYALDAGLLPPLLRLGHGARTFPSQSAFLHFVLAIALAAGTSLALSPRHSG
jgi:hypothetical protein